MEGLLRCLAHLEGEFPEGFLPVLRATRSALEEDLAYLRGLGD